MTYDRRVLASIPGDERVVTPSDSFFEDTAAEVADVLRALRMEVPKDVRERAYAGIDLWQTHYRVVADDPAEGAMLIGPGSSRP